MKNNFCTLRRAFRKACVALVVFAVIPGWVMSSLASSLPAEYVDDHHEKSRLFVLTDMGNEPDDQMSFVRLLLYANEIDIEGLVASTSTWQKEKVHPETLHKIIDVYGSVRKNLLVHADGWPGTERLHGIVGQGHSVYGLAALKEETLSAGAKALIQAVDRKDERPLWVTLWGGATTLAEALNHVRQSREPAEVERFINRIRVYSISDQDNAGPWIREQFPELFYIVTPSRPDGSNYYYATWTGISGDGYYRNGEGAASELVSNEWLEAHVRRKGPLGKVYPEYWFIMEGDTPSFLNLLGNGLSSYQNPAWGGWGGRYLYLQPYGESSPVWSQGGDLFDRVTSQDTVRGEDGNLYTSDQATIWRWREAYQHDFAARMDWTIRPYDEANHQPQVVLNGESGTRPLFVEAKVGDKIRLDAALTKDPDGDSLSYQWFHYREAGYLPSRGMADISVIDPAASATTVQVNNSCRPKWLEGFVPCESEGVAHVILAVTDDGKPSLTSYRRVIINVVSEAEGDEQTERQSP